MNVPLLVATAAVGMMACELLWPGGRWPRVPGWLGRAALLTSVQVLAVFVGGATWDRWLAGAGLFDGRALGTLGGALAGYLAITFVYYWWHRARHEVPLLWRWLHQVHHSARRIEVVTSFYKHPLEIAANGLLTSAILYALLGVSPAAGAAAVLLTGLAELFYHWNVRTPYWLGFVIQRPESHCVHHQHGRHRNNYSDLPLWDLLFGTFENPRVRPAACGFDAARERQLAPMLRGRDVHQEIAS